MRSTEKWGVDVDTAVDLALKDLKLTRDEVEIEVLEESTNGFLGIGSKLAKVRVTAKDDISDKNPKEKAKLEDIDAILAGLPENSTHELDEEVREDFEKYEQEEREDARARAKENKREKAARRYQNEQPVIEDIILDEVKKLEPVENHVLKEFLSDIAEKMGIELSFEVRVGEDMVYVEAMGPDTGTIIGKRGQTLDAVQTLASYVINKDSDNYIRVVVDAENYRNKREKTLIALANRLASKVERSGRSMTLEPMNPFERKVIHSTLQNHPAVKTRSEGRDPYRKVVIELQ